MRLPLIALAAALLAAGCSSSTVAPSVQAFALENPTEVLNSLRRKRGLQPLARDAKLDALSREQSKLMARKRRMGHKVAFGQGFAARMKRGGVKTLSAENVAVGQRSTGRVLQAWMDSRGHRRNMMDKRMTRYGLARVEGRDGRPYWTMILAR